jgi:fatty-acyl-CoA synthase
MAGGDDFSGLLARRPGQLAFSRDIDPGEVAIYIHTGGTTGTPKVARITHMGLAYQFWVNSWMKGLTHNDRIFSGTPYFHSGGIINVSLVALGNGMTQTILGPMGYRNRRMTDNLWKLVERFGITHLNVVPTIFSVLAANPPADDKCCNFLSRLTMI